MLRTLKSFFHHYISVFLLSSLGMCTSPCVKRHRDSSCCLLPGMQAKVVVNGVQTLNTPLSYVKSGAVGKAQSHLSVTGFVSLRAGDLVTLQVGQSLSSLSIRLKSCHCVFKNALTEYGKNNQVL